MSPYSPDAAIDADFTQGRAYVLIEDGRPGGKTHLFTDPVEIIQAFTPEDVPTAFARMSDAQRTGFYVVGYAAYELGYALEPKFKSLTLPVPDAPLLQFGLFRQPQPLIFSSNEHPMRLPLTAMWDQEEYAKRFESCRQAIRAGDVYQVNLTFPLTGAYAGDALSLYRSLRSRQPVAIGGIVALGGPTIVSLSPELFFETDCRKIRTRPMKGTIQRGRNATLDAERMRQLYEDEKSRAENLMIVDLLRNDLSRLAELGSVKVTDLFSIETYPTLHQMTSGIEATMRDGVSIEALFTAMFPCGSVTGAPKIRAMEIIRSLESVPRGAYCGAVGMITPEGEMQFNVAIRTATLARDGELTVNVGSAIVADSEMEKEYEECLIKAQFITSPISD